MLQTREPPAPEPEAAPKGDIMKRMPVLAISAPLLLIGAAHPDLAAHHDGTAASSATATGPATYRPCRPGAGDDRCIQLYEQIGRAHV